MHLTDGELRSYQDHELHGLDRERVKVHLETCPKCREQAARLAARSSRVDGRLAAIAPHSSQAPRSLGAARARLHARILEKENTSMFKKIFTRPYRPAWIGLAVIALLAVSLAFPPVQAIANSFLGLFRVQQVSVIPVNPGDLPERLGSSSQLEAMFSEDIQVEEGGDPYTVASASEASAQAGIPVRLPEQVEGEPILKIQPASKATLNVDLDRVRALLNEIGRSDIQLPDELDGSTVVIDVPAGVLAQYGSCEFDREAAREHGYDPDDPDSIRLPDCTALVQMPSPTITAPPGLDVEKVGEAFLQLVGMSPEEAARFASNVDWTTTLVVPIPRYGSTYQDVVVDGVSGTLIEQDLQDHPNQFMLIWVKDGIVYALTGPGDSATALSLANSLK